MFYEGCRFYDIVSRCSMGIRWRGVYAAATTNQTESITKISAVAQRNARTSLKTRSLGLRVCPNAISLLKIFRVYRIPLTHFNIRASDRCLRLLHLVWQRVCVCSGYKTRAYYRALCAHAPMLVTNSHMRTQRQTVCVPSARCSSTLAASPCSMMVECKAQTRMLHRKI